MAADQSGPSEASLHACRANGSKCGLIHSHGYRRGPSDASSRTCRAESSERGLFIAHEGPRGTSDTSTNAYVSEGSPYTHADGKGLE